MQNNADIFYRIAGGLVVMSSLWNMLLSFIWFISLVWFCVGVFWLIPGVLALLYMGGGIYLLATGRQTKVAAFLPALGLMISMMNFNLTAGMLDLIALVLGVVGFSQNVDEEPAGA